MAISVGDKVTFYMNHAGSMRARPAVVTGVFRDEIGVACSLKVDLAPDEIEGGISPDQEWSRQATSGPESGAWALTS
jgi:hypothetical protein